MPADVVGHQHPSFDELIAAWHPLIWFANSLNPSLGHPDWYPCALGPAVVAKLRMVHKLIQAGRQPAAAASAAT